MAKLGIRVHAHIKTSDAVVHRQCAFGGEGSGKGEQKDGMGEYVEECVWESVQADIVSSDPHPTIQLQLQLHI